MKYRDLDRLRMSAVWLWAEAALHRCGERPIAMKFWQPSRRQWRTASISLIWHPCTVTVRRSELLLPECHYPDDIKVTTKCMLGDAPAEEIDDRLRRSLDQSCERLNRDYVDGHSPWLRNGRWLGGCRSSQSVAPSRSASTKHHSGCAAFQRLKKKGGLEPGVLLQRRYRMLISACWRWTKDRTLCNALQTLLTVQAAWQWPPVRHHRAIIRAASEYGCGVMGIRAVAAGA